jgi:hypothetical protein
MRPTVATSLASSRRNAEARFQVAYARYLTDERFRQSVRAASSADGSIEGLSGADINRLRAMDQDRVELFDKCLFGNRIAAIAEAFPLSVKVMADALPALVKDLDAQNVAVDTRKYPEAVRFADFVLNGGSANAHALSDPILGLLHYELTVLNLRLRPQLPTWPESTIRSAKAFLESLVDANDLALVLNPNHALLGVGFDVDALRELPPDAAPPAPLETDMVVLLHRSDTGGVGQMGLNHASAAAVLMIDEARTLHGLIAAYCAWLGRERGAGLEKELSELCMSLCECGALGFEPLPGTASEPAAAHAGGDAA